MAESINVYYHFIPYRYLGKGGTKVRLYAMLRYSIGGGEREERRTEQYYLIPETAYIKDRIGTIEESLPVMFRECNEEERRHNKHAKAELEKKKAELLYELHYELISISGSSAEKIREAKQTDFLSLYNRFIEHLLTVGSAEGTVRNYEQTRDKIVQFRSGALLGHVNTQFVEKFQQHLLASGLARNTVARHMTALNACLSWLFTNDMIDVSPFAKLRKGTRIYQDDDSLTNPQLRSKSFFSPEELKTIWEQRYDRKRREENDTTLAWLFSNMVGLRYCDMVTLRPAEIKKTEKDGVLYYYIDKYQGKTKRKVFVPLNKTALLILNEVKERNPTARILLFRMNSNRSLDGVEGTDKKIRYGNSRHSFGNNLRRANVQDSDIDRLSGRKAKGITEKNYIDTFLNNIDYYHELVSRISFL